MSTRAGSNKIPNTNEAVQDRVYSPGCSALSLAFLARMMACCRRIFILHCGLLLQTYPVFCIRNG